MTAPQRKFRISSQFPPRLRELGVASDRLLAEARLPADLFDQPRILLDTDQFFALWQGIGTLSPDPLLAFSLGEDFARESYDPISMAVLSSANLGDALERIGRYKQISCPEKIAVARGRTETQVRFLWLERHGLEPDFLTDSCFAFLLAVARRGLGTPIYPLRVELSRPTRQARRLSAFFRCPVRFRCPENVLALRTEDLDRPFLSHNAEMLEMLTPALDRQLEELGVADDLLARVHQLLCLRLAGQKPSIDGIARELRMSSRTLQRKLAAAGTTFQRLVAEARHELARHHLRHSTFELPEIAYLLGFEDSNSLIRAFHEWEGQPPAAWRARQQGRPAEQAVA